MLWGFTAFRLEKGVSGEYLYRVIGFYVRGYVWKGVPFLRGFCKESSACEFTL